MSIRSDEHFEASGRNAKEVSRRRFLGGAAWVGVVLGATGIGGELRPRSGGIAGASGTEVTGKTVAERTVAEETLAGKTTTKAENVVHKDVAPEEKPPTVELGEYRTDYRHSDSKARKYNLRISARAVDGTVLEPGGVFSMNGHLVGLDYKRAEVFAEGGETSALGGGLCHVTSTVYMAAQYAGLEMLERHPTTRCCPKWNNGGIIEP